jgi:release factor glutamine methyltransferase
VLATETSPGALATASRNVAVLAPDAVQLRRAHLMAETPMPVDVVVANLPYIPSAELDQLAPELAFEPRQALDGGPSGLEVMRELLAQARQRLRRGSVLLLECGHDQATALSRIARDHWPGAAIAVHADLAGIERFVEIEL